MKITSEWLKSAGANGVALELFALKFGEDVTINSHFINKLIKKNVSWLLQLAAVNIDFAREFVKLNVNTKLAKHDEHVAIHVDGDKVIFTGKDIISGKVVYSNGKRIKESNKNVHKIINPAILLIEGNGVL